MQIEWSKFHGKRPPFGPRATVLVRKCAESRYPGARDRVCIVPSRIQGAIRCAFQARIEWSSFQSKWTRSEAVAGVLVENDLNRPKMEKKTARTLCSANGFKPQQHVKGIGGGSKALNWILNITGTLVQDIGCRIRTLDGPSKKRGGGKKYISASLTGRAAAITPKFIYLKVSDSSEIF
ncbi:hypothetical protein B0H17DRAFT_1137534 [Mycena rosella]|uniref:Uncharacterized protein n=1 Tax=Mycena rosella TaxID=1033263 RepID=A0AAD7D8E1_MYCRO|nr:hypothetical protein B0H17DRAFT_1137534 [Mycena rosella]